MTSKRENSYWYKIEIIYTKNVKLSEKGIDYLATTQTEKRTKKTSENSKQLEKHGRGELRKFSFFIFCLT